MHNRNEFLKTSVLGLGSLALAPSFNQLFAAANVGGIPRRFIFIRKSSGIRPSEIALRDFSDRDKGH